MEEEENIWDMNNGRTYINPMPPKAEVATYQCPSYYDDGGVLRDCKCGKCGLDEVDQALAKLAKDVAASLVARDESAMASALGRASKTLHALRPQGGSASQNELRKQFVEFFRAQTFEMWRGLSEVADLNELMSLTEDQLNNAEAEQINEFGEAMWHWFLAHQPQAQTSQLAVQQKITCSNCGREGIPDWDGRGYCITCARNLLGDAWPAVGEGSPMLKVRVAFDIDGTLRANREERHRTEVEANSRIVELLKATAHSKNVEVHLWSNRGADYCREMREVLGLQEYVRESHCHKKLWADQQRRLEGTYDYFRPHIAYDDQQRFDGAPVVIVVREK